MTALVVRGSQPPGASGSLYVHWQLRCPYDDAHVIRVEDRATCPTCRRRWVYRHLDTDGWNWREEDGDIA